MRAAAVLLLLAPAPAVAACEASAPLSADGRVLGHLPYGEASPADLVRVPPGLALRGPCRLRPELLPDLQRLVDAAAASGLGTLRLASCFRSIGWQTGVFCREAGTAPDVRAISVAPPGHSEHGTGLAFDVAIRPSPGCPDVDGCMAALPLARWLAGNAARFGFEQSFPAGNRQGVKWEPWHWRWVGATADAPGAARARFLFARARREFPANPAVP